MEQAQAVKRHHNAVTVACFNDVIVTNGAARLYNRAHTAAARALNVVSEREEGIRAKAHARKLCQSALRGAR